MAIIALSLISVLAYENYNGLHPYPSMEVTMSNLSAHLLEATKSNSDAHLWIWPILTTMPTNGFDLL